MTFEILALFIFLFGLEEVEATKMAHGPIPCSVDSAGIQQPAEVWIL